MLSFVLFICWYPDTWKDYQHKINYLKLDEKDHRIAQTLIFTIIMIYKKKAFYFSKYFIN